MTLNKKHCLIFLAIFVIMLLGVSMVSATTDTNNMQEENGNIKISTPNNNDVDNMVQSSTSEAKLDADVEKTITSDNNTINTKTITKNQLTQTETQPITVTDYAGFKSALTSSEYEDITITLGEDIVSDSSITVDSAIKNLVIEGNSKTINGNSIAFLKVSNMNLTIKNVTITNCVAPTNSVLYATNSNVTILNSTISNSQATGNDGVVFNVASGNVILEENIFQGNRVGSRTTGFIISVPQTSKIVNNTFIDNINTNNTQYTKYDSLLKSEVNEIHDNNYFGNYLASYFDFSQIDINAFNQLDVYDDIELHLYRVVNNKYNHTVASGKVIAEYQRSGLQHEFDVIDGLANITLTYDELIDNMGDDTTVVVVSFTYISEDNSYSESSHSLMCFPSEVNPTLTATVNPSSGHLGDSFIISGTLIDEDDSSMIGNTVTLNLSNGYTATAIVNATGYRFNYTPDALGPYTATVSVAKHGGITRAKTRTVTFNVEGDPSYISIYTDISEVTGAKPVKVYGVLTDKDGNPIGGATVNLTFKNQLKATTTTDSVTGEYSFDYITDVCDSTENNLKVVYGGNTEQGINATSNSTTLKVNGYSTNISFTASDTQYGGQTNVTGYVYDIETGDIIQTGQVSIKLTNVNNPVTVNIVDGKFEYLRSYTNLGTKDATVTFISSGLYASSVNITQFTVTKGITNATINTNGPIKVDDTLTVSGKLSNDFGDHIGSRVYLTVTMGTQTKSVRTNNNGIYSTTFTLTDIGDYDIIVEWEGNNNYFNCKNTTVFSLYKIPTITNVTVVDDRVNQVTIDVIITENDTKFTDIIKSGMINVTVGGESKLYDIDSSGTTRIILDDNVNITTTDEVDFKVEFVESNVDLNSTGINNTTGEVITKFTAKPIGSNITVSVSPLVQNITENVTITGEVFDEFGSYIEEGTVTISINNTEPITVPFTDGKYEYNFTTSFGGQIPFNVTYNGKKSEQGNFIINESKNSSYFVVEKLPTVTNVTLLNNSFGNVTIRVNVTDARNTSNFVTTGVIQVYDFINSKILVQEYPVANSNVELILPIDSTGIFKLLIYYPENHIYLESNARNESAFAFDKDVYVINVEKLDSIANVEEILSNKSGEVTLRINVTNTTGDLIGDGHVIVVNSTNGELLGEGDIEDGNVDILLESVTEPGVIEVNVTYMGNDFYLPSNATGYDKPSGDNITVITVTVDPEITISLSESIVVINESVNIMGEVFNTTHGMKHDGGKVIVLINETPVNAEFNAETGNYVGVYVPLSSGVYTVNASYYDNNNQLVVTSENVLLNVNKINSSTSVTVVNNTAGNVILNISVAGVDGNKSMTGQVNITINGNIIVPVELSGEETVTVKLADNITHSGSVSVVVDFIENDRYYSSTASTTMINVLNQTPILSVSVSEENVVNSTIVLITGNLTDDLDNKLSDSYIEISVDNEVVAIVKTDNNGVFSLDYVTDKLGEIIVNATYYGDNIRYSNATDNTKFYVYKLNTTIELNVSDINYTDVEILNLTLNETNATGLVTVVVTGNTEEGSISITEIYEYNGEIIQVPLSQLSAGQYDVTVSYEGDSKFNGNTTRQSFKVLPTNDYILPVTAVNITFGENETITVTTPDDATGFVTISIDGTDISEQVPINDSQAKLVIDAYELPASEYTVNVEFSDSNYAIKTNSTKFNVSKAESSVNVIVENITRGYSETIIVSLPEYEHATGNISVKITKDDYVYKYIIEASELDEGIAFNTIEGLTEGTYTVEVLFTNDTNYNNSRKVAEFNVVLPEIIIFDSETIFVDEYVLIHGIVTDPNGNEIMGTIRLDINGTISDISYIDYVKGINQLFSKDGVYTVNATYMLDDEEIVISDNIKITVNKIPTSTTVVVDNNKVGNCSIVVTVRDKDNNPVTNGTIRVSLPDEVITSTVSGESTVVPITTEVAGVLPVSVEYLENSEYVNSSANTELTVIKTNTTITVNVNTPVKYGEESIVSGVLLDEYNKPVTGAKVEIKVDGEVYTNVTTDGDGNYNAIISDIIVGTHDVEAVYAGDNKYVGSNDSTSLTVEKLESKLTVNSTSPVSVDEDVEISGKLLDENDKPISGVTVQVNYDGNIENVTTDKNGYYNVSFLVTSSGEKNVTATFIGDDRYYASQADGISIADKGSATIEVNLPDDAKVGESTSITGNVTDKNGNALANMPVTVSVNGKAIRTLTDENGNFQVDGIIPVEGVNTVEVSAGDDNYDVEDVTGNFTAKKLEAFISLNSISDKKVDDKVNITGKLVDEQNNPITNVPIELTVNDKTVTVVTDGNGDYEYITDNIVEGLNNVSVKYENRDYNTATNNTTVSASKYKTTVTVADIVGIFGEDVVLTAYVTDEDGNPVSGGSLIFKLNGLTLRVDGRFDNKTASPYKFKVENGVVTFTLKADVLRGGKNLTASYSGSYKYEGARANVASVNVSKRTAQVMVSITPNNTRQNNDIVFTATLNDVTPNATNATCITTDATIIFKLNGITLKNSSGEPDYISVNSTVVNYVYHVPTGMKGIDQNGIRNYTVEAIYDNPLFNSDVRNSSVFNVIRSKININFINTTVKDDVLSVNATFTDFEDNLVVGTNRVCVKINGKTYQEDGKAKYFNVKDGKVDLTGIKLSGTKVKSVMLVTGDCEAYLGARATTTDIVEC